MGCSAAPRQTLQGSIVLRQRDSQYMNRENISVTERLILKGGKSSLSHRVPLVAFTVSNDLEFPKRPPRSKSH